jgi:hypothetical protein
MGQSRSFAGVWREITPERVNLDYIPLKVELIPVPKTEFIGRKPVQAGGLIYPVNVTNEPKEPTPEEIIKRNIEMLGGIQSSVQPLEPSLKLNEMRHFDMNLTSEPIPTPTAQPFGRTLEYLSPLRAIIYHE